MFVQLVVIQDGRHFSGFPPEENPKMNKHPCILLPGVRKLREPEGLPILL